MTAPLDPLAPPIHDAKLEEKPLGLLIEQYEQAREYAQELSPNLFYDLRNKAAFRAIKALLAEHAAPTRDRVIERLIETEENFCLKTAPKLVDQLIKHAPDIFDLPEIIAELKDLSRRRTIELNMTTRWRVMLRDCGTPVDSLAKDIAAACSGLARNGHNALSEEWIGGTLDAAELVLEELPPVVEIVKGIMAEHSKLVIGSGSKSFKTWLVIHMGLCIAHGLDWLVRETTRKKVLFLNLELKKNTFTRRLKAIARALGIKVDKSWFKVLHLRGKLARKLPVEIVNAVIDVAKHFEAEVVFIDPLYKFQAGREENSAGDQTELMNEIDRITTEATCTVIFTDHFGKGNQAEKDPLDTLRGSSAKGGDVDAAMILRKHDVEESYRVDIIHRELAPVNPFVIGWNFPTFELRPELNAADMKKAQGGQSKKYDPVKLLEVIQSNTIKNPISISAWAEKANIKRPTLNDYLPTIRTKGWIATVGAGTNARTFITDKGLEALC